MKKTFFALVAAGAFTGAAAAESNVTIYGLLDASLVGESGGAAGSVSKLTSGVANGSRLGFKGKEDLGNGLAAIFTLENGFNLDAGTMGQGGLLFGRQAFVGLSGAFGTVKLGRQYTPVDTVIATTDPFGNGMAGRGQNVFSAGYIARFNNGVMYNTPKVNGFSADLSYGFGETAGNSAANRYAALAAGYEQGPVYLRLAHQKTNDATGTGAVKNTVLGGIVDFGLAQAHLAYSINKRSAAGLTTFDSNDVLIGTSVPYGAGKFMASYVHKNDKLALNKDASQIGVGYIHAMSKRTSVYAAYGRIDNNNGATYTVGNATEAGSGDRAYNLGMRHTF